MSSLIDMNIKKPADLTQHTRTYKLPAGLRVTFSLLPDGSYQVEWDPRIPTISSVGRRGKFIKAYQRARADYLRDIAHLLKGSVAVVDVDGEGALVGSEIFRPPRSH